MNLTQFLSFYLSLFFFIFSYCLRAVLSSFSTIFVAFQIFFVVVHYVLVPFSCLFVMCILSLYVWLRFAVQFLHFLGFFFILQFAPITDNDNNIVYGFICFTSRSSFDSSNSFLDATTDCIRTNYFLYFTLFCFR